MSPINMMTPKIAHPAPLMEPVQDPGPNDWLLHVWTCAFTAAWNPIITKTAITMKTIPATKNPVRIQRGSEIHGIVFPTGVGNGCG
jgi:hypothetical protein